MSKPTKIEDIIAETANLSNRKMARKIRGEILGELFKFAQSAGVLQHPSKNVVEYETRSNYHATRGGKADASQLYGVGLPERKNTDLSTKTYSRSLSTRYSPDRIGVQALRVSDGVRKDPITNKEYDWNEGFTTESGEKFSGGSVALQTDIEYHE